MCSNYFHIFCLQDELEIEDFLWRYIAKYHTDKLHSIFTPGINYRYSRDTPLCKLQIESANGESVVTASDGIVTLYQEVADCVVEETFQLPQDADETVLLQEVKDITENKKLLFYVSHDNMCHIVGHNEGVRSLKQHLLDITSASVNPANPVNVKKAAEADGNQEWTASEADRARPVSERTSDSYSMITPGGVRVEIYRGNLVDEQVDAIVNPANSQLRHGSGAARAIADAAGLQLQRECKDFIRQHQHLRVTEVMHTSAGNLMPKIKYVLHAVGPHAAKFPDASELFQALTETFVNCFQYADAVLHASSISVPAVSSGTCCSCCCCLVFLQTDLESAFIGLICIDVIICNACFHTVSWMYLPDWCVIPYDVVRL